MRAWCGPYDDENGDTEAVHIRVGELPRSGAPTAYWMLSAVRADIEREPVTSLPNDFVYTEPRGASLFAFDVEDSRNELSSADEESKGAIRVELEGCEPGDTVRVSFDHVRLGSEYYDLAKLSVDGSVLAEIER